LSNSDATAIPFFAIFPAIRAFRISLLLQCGAVKYALGETALARAAHIDHFLDFLERADRRARKPA
jgi:hypothetical protein